MAGEGEDDGGLRGDVDLIGYIRSEMEKLYAEEVAARYEELVIGPRLNNMAEAMRNVQTGMTGLAKVVEGVSQTFSIWDEIWNVNERPQKFTPAEFNKLWDGFTEERKIEYVLSLIS